MSKNYDQSQGRTEPDSVFTPELIDQAKDKWQDLSPLEQVKAEYVCWFVLSPSAKAEAIRKEIDAWLRYLPNDKRDEFTGMLAQLKSEAVHVYHELAMRDALAQLGCDAEYEWTVRDILHATECPPLSGPIMGKTPDWFVRGSEAVPAFLVDVHTAEVPGQQPGSLERIYAVMTEIEKIEVDAELALLPPPNVHKLPNDFVNKVSAAVRNWLTTVDPDPGAQLRIGRRTLQVLEASSGRITDQGAHASEGADKSEEQEQEEVGVSFQVRVRRTGHPHVKVVPAPREFHVVIEYLYSKIEGKVATYAAANLPLVIAVVADPRTGLRVLDFEDAVLGERLMRPELTDAGIEMVKDRQPNGIFGMLPPRSQAALTALIWIERSSIGTWQIQALHNPLARHPLPMSTFHK